MNYGQNFRKINGSGFLLIRGLGFRVFGFGVCGLGLYMCVNMKDYTVLNYQKNPMPLGNCNSDDSSSYWPWSKLLVSPLMTPKIGTLYSPLDNSL